MVTDRDCLIAATSAIIALAEKITGERMTIHLRTESGTEVQIAGADVSWSPIDQVDKTAREAATAQHELC